MFMNNYVKLFKKTPFNDTVIYTAYGPGFTAVTGDIITILDKCLSDTDILCHSPDILMDVLRAIPFKKEIIFSNADFTQPIAIDLIVDNTVLVIFGCYTSGYETYNQITQIGFIYNDFKIRMGIINNE